MQNIWGIRRIASVFVQSAKEMARVNTQAVPTAIQKRNLSLSSVVVTLFQRIVRRLQNIAMGAKRRLKGIQKITPRKQQTVSCSYMDWYGWCDSWFHYRTDIHQRKN